MAITVIAALIVLMLRIEDLSLFSITKDGLNAELSNIKQKVKNIENEVSLLNIAMVLDAFEYKTLKKIKGDIEDSYNFGFPNEQYLLERLRNRGLIEEHNSDSVFKNKNTRDINLRKHFSITEKGKKYLDFVDKQKKEIGEELEQIAKKIDKSIK